MRLWVIAVIFWVIARVLLGVCLEVVSQCFDFLIDS